MADSTSTKPYTSAVLFALFSFLFMLLTIPPMFWHFRNRNIGATALVAWTILHLLMNFINAVLWPSDAISTWYDGVGLCDVEVKLQVAAFVGIPASMVCILRGLAAVMDTDRAAMTQTKTRQRRNYIIDMTCCVAFPLLHMVLHYVVQARRYYVYGISGCVPAVSDSWPSIVLLAVPQSIWTLIATYFAVIILIRLRRYRLTFNTILANSNTTKSRFMRLYAICILTILGSIPIQGFTMYRNIKIIGDVPYTWSSVHDAEDWKSILMVPSGGVVTFDRWTRLISGILVFACFGLGREAVTMYRNGLLSLRLDKIFPSLKNDHRGSVSATVSSLGSKARLMFKRKSFTSTWTSTTTSSSGTFSPSNKRALHAISEISSDDGGHRQSQQEHFRTYEDVEQAARTSKKPSLLSRVSSLFQTKTRRPASQSLPLSDFSGQHGTVHSTVISRPRSPILSTHARDASSDDVMVTREVRQGSEHAETLPALTFGSK